MVDSLRRRPWRYYRQHGFQIAVAANLLEGVALGQLISTGGSLLALQTLLLLFSRMVIFFIFPIQLGDGRWRVTQVGHNGRALGGALPLPHRGDQHIGGGVEHPVGRGRGEGGGGHLGVRGVGSGKGEGGGHLGFRGGGLLEVQGVAGVGGRGGRGGWSQGFLAPCPPDLAARHVTAPGGRSAVPGVSRSLVLLGSRMVGVGLRGSPCFWGSRARVARGAQPKGEVGPHLAVQGVQGEAGLPPRRPHPGEGVEEAVHLPPVGVLHGGGHGVTSSLSILVPVISEDKITGRGAAVGHVLPLRWVHRYPGIPKQTERVK